MHGPSLQQAPLLKARVHGPPRFDTLLLLLSRTLAEETLRVNRHIHSKLDMSDDRFPFESKELSNMLTYQQALLETLMVEPDWQPRVFPRTPHHRVPTRTGQEHT